MTTKWEENQKDKPMTSDSLRENKELRRKGNWFSKSLELFDMCYCSSDCLNTECSRCMESEHFKAMRRELKKNPYRTYSVSDFSEKCKSFK